MRSCVPHLLMLFKEYSGYTVENSTFQLLRSCQTFDARRRPQSNTGFHVPARRGTCATSISRSTYIKQTFTEKREVVVVRLHPLDVEQSYILFAMNTDSYICLELCTKSGNMSTSAMSAEPRMRCKKRRVYHHCHRTCANMTAALRRSMLS